MKSILMVGGAGFIGANLTPYLMQSHPDYQIIHLDKLLTTEGHKAVKTFEQTPKYMFEHGDAAIAQRVDNIFKNQNVQEVIILVDMPQPEKTPNNPRVVLDSNLISVFTILETAKAYWMEAPFVYQPEYTGCRIHLVSSTDVYGIQPRGTLLDENTRLIPETPYAAVKASAETLALAYMKQYGINISISRLGHVFGPGQSENGFIPRIIRKAQAEKHLHLSYRGTRKHSWIYIDDAIRGLCAVLDKGTTGSIYNIDSHDIYSDLEITRMICAVLDIKTPRTYGKKYEQLISFRGEALLSDIQVKTDLAKTQKDLNWQATEAFDINLIKTISTYVK